MKKSLFLLIFFALSFHSYAQLKVSANGVRIGDDTDARYTLDIAKNTGNEPTAQFGTFGIQSIVDNVGFLSHQGFWNGSAMQATKTGKMALVQFAAGKVMFRTTPQTTAGNNASTIFRHLVGVNDGTNAFTGINENNPTNTLHVTGNAFKSDGNANWDIASDARLKTGIQEYKKGLNVVMRLKPSKWKYNGRAGTIAGSEVVGLVAQEVQKVLPSMVSNFTYVEGGNENIMEMGESRGNKETYLKLNTSELTFILINAVKEQQAIIDEMRKEVQELRSMVGSKTKSTPKQSSSKNN
jgi:hypothetical protein